MSGKSAWFVEPGAKTSSAQRSGRLTQLLSTADMGSANRARILQALADYGPLSRAELARMAQVPRATIGGIVNSLVDSGLLEEAAPQAPAAGIGKPARPLWFGSGAGLSGAVLVRAGAVETAVVDARGEILDRRSERFASNTGTARLDAQLADAAAGLLERHRDALIGVGLALPAACDPADGRVVASTTVPGLVGTRLPRLLSERLGVGVVVEEDARALAVGQRWFGQARRVEDFAALQIGAGIGAGIMLGGHLSRGRGVSSAEIGHTCVQIDGDRCRCGLRGCWETIASLRWLRRRAAELGLPDARATTPAALARRAARGDERAADLLDTYADHVAVGVSNLIQILPLRLFVLHGEVVGGGEPLLEAIRAAVARRTLPTPGEAPRIEFAVVDQDAGLLGAAATLLTHRLGIVL